MLYTKLLPICLIILFYSACNPRNEQNQQTKKTNTSIELPDSSKKLSEIEKQENKIYRIKGKSVIFFMANNTEYDHLLKNAGDNNQWEFQGIFNNFRLIAGSFKSTLERQKITTELTTAKYFEIETKDGQIIKFDRTKENQIIGQIISDGENQPRIEYGIMNGKDLMELIQNYFKIKDLNYVVPELPKQIDTAYQNKNKNKKQ